MARRGRRQVLQLDDVTSSHPSRHRTFVSTQTREIRRELPSNPLLNLVGYGSDESSDENSDRNSIKGEEKTPPRLELKDNTAADGEGELVLEIPLPAEAESPNCPELPEGSELLKGAEPLKSVESIRAPESMPQAEPPTIESMQDIPLPESSGPQQQSQLNSTIDYEVANFLAEIDSISAEKAPPDEEDTASLSTTSDLPTTTSLPTTTILPTIASLPETADSSQPPEIDLGFIPRPDASVSVVTEESKPVPVVEEKKNVLLASNAYQSMFVKGASEFVKQEKEEEKKENGAEVEEELPEEPVSEWQIVQDDATQHYYYWNIVTNQVTWEIPPGYTQFLLLYKEYQERIAAIPKDKLKRMKEKKKQKSNTGRESSPAPSTSKPKKDKKHKRDKHRKEVSEPSSSLPGVEIGPQLPPTPAEGSSDEVGVKADQSDADKTGEGRNSLSPKSSSEEVKEGKVCETLDSAVDSTSVSVPRDVEAIFDAALSAITESSDTVKHDIPVAACDSEESVTSGKAAAPVDMFKVSSPAPSMDVTTSAASVDSSKSSADSLKSISAESSKSGSPTPTETDLAPTALAVTTNTSVVSSSSVVSSVSVLGKDSKDCGVDSGEGVVTNSGVNDSTALEEDDDDFDVDFDNLEDLDRVLEKALEKKLEKKKAELKKLESKSEEDGIALDAYASSLSTHSIQSEDFEQTTEPESAVSSSVKNTSLHSPSASSSNKFSSASSPISGDKDTADSSEVRSQPSRPKRSAAESSTKEGAEKQEPTAKKARLVAYDAVETDEESVDASEEVSTTPAQPVKMSEDDLDSFADVLPTPPPEPVDNLAEIKDMADTAFAKLAFLDVTVDSLTSLQASLIALQTRMTDWQNGGLNGEYFFQQLKEVSKLLTHYESCAVPAGWTCQWDSSFRRYFYINGSTGETQWDYPDIATGDAPKTDERRSKKGRSSKKKRSKIVGPAPPPSASNEESEAAAAHQDGSVTYQDGMTADLDGVAMSKEEAGSSDLWQVNGRSVDNQPSTSTDGAGPVQGEGVSSADQDLYPGEPLPPGTELLLGLPPPPPPPLPADEAATTSTTDDAYVCGDDSSDEGSEKAETRGKEKMEETVDMHNLDPDIDGEEMVEEEDEEGRMMVERKEEEELVAAMVVEDPAVISRPPQLRFPPTTASSAVAFVSSSSSLSGHMSGAESSSQPVLSAPPVLNAASGGGQLLPDSASSIASSAVITSHSAKPLSPKPEEQQRFSGSPGPVHEPSSSSSSADHHKHDKSDKHKKKKKEMLGSQSMSMKKKKVTKLVQHWQKVRKEVEKEERADQQRQMAIRQQLDEWKRENS